MIYDCECPLCFFDDCIRLFAGILLDTEAMKKMKPLTLVYKEEKEKKLELHMAKHFRCFLLRHAVSHTRGILWNMSPTAQCILAGLFYMR